MARGVSGEHELSRWWSARRAAADRRLVAAGCSARPAAVDRHQVHLVSDLREQRAARGCSRSAPLGWSAPRRAGASRHAWGNSLHDEPASRSHQDPTAIPGTIDIWAARLNGAKEAGPAHRGGDRGRDEDRILVLPGPQDRPARIRELLVSVVVAAPVALDLRSPPVAVVARPVAVQRATVPETAVDKDRDPQPREDQIGSSAHASQGRSVDEVAQSEGMDCAAHREFGGGVAPARARHPQTDGGGRRRQRGLAWEGHAPQCDGRSGSPV